ncbi:hypothetical protein CJJ17_10750 [Gordonia polyisoprenivorans]|nr:hypothetical protein CJJ17_10750 [Gordonia polyisoprenivorans]
MVRILIGERGLEASSLALLGTSTIGKDPPVVEVRAACGEPRDPGEMTSIAITSTTHSTQQSARST